MRATFALATALLAAVPAAHPDRLVEVKANLDGDRALEVVVGQEGASVDHKTWFAFVEIVDRCGGRERVHRLTKSYRSLDAAKVVQADGRGRREVLAVVQGFPGEGEAKLVRLTDRRGACPVPKALFAYSPGRPKPLPFALVSFSVTVAELNARYRGREVRLLETFEFQPLRRERESLYRYVRATDRYVLYRTSWRTIP